MVPVTGLGDAAAGVATVGPATGSAEEQRVHDDIDGN